MTEPVRGRFVSLEGIEGVGKSTNVGFVADALRARGIAVTVTREPGGTDLAEAIRELVLAPSGEHVEPLTEVLLMFAARRQHVARVIEPALAKGTWVVCDRFTDATLAYQGFGRGFPIERIRTLADWAHGNAWPDLTLLLDADVTLSVARRRGRGGGEDRFEAEQAAFFERVRDGYLTLAREQPARFRVVDAALDLAAVQVALQQALDVLLEGASQ